MDADRNPILTRSEVYSGVYGRASINVLRVQQLRQSSGIACGLNNLQKIRDGEPLGGKASAESDFATDEDDDFLDLMEVTTMNATTILCILLLSLYLLLAVFWIVRSIIDTIDDRKRRSVMLLERA